MNTSILNPFGSLSCGTGNLSAAMGKGGGLMPRSLVAASEVGWLGVGGGGVGVDCWAAAEKAANVLASVAASNNVRRGEKRMGMRSSLIVRLLGRLLGRSVRQVAPQAQSESQIGVDARGRLTCGGRRRERRSSPPRVRRPGRGRERGDTPDRLRWRRR